MADSVYDIVHTPKHYATQAGAIAALTTGRWGYAEDTGVFIINYAGTPKYFYNSVKMALTTGDDVTGMTYGAGLIGSAGITGVTPRGGSSGSVGTVYDMLVGLRDYTSGLYVDGSGTAGTIPIWSDTDTIGDSIITYAAGVMTQTYSVAGSSNRYLVTNADNTNAASHSKLEVKTGGGSGGDPFILFTVSGVTDWAMGIDNSASDTFVLAASTDLGTSNVFSTTTGGITTLGGTGQFIVPDGGGMLSTISSNRTMITRSGTELEIGDTDGWTGVNFRSNSGTFDWAFSSTTYMTLNTNASLVVGTNGFTALSSIYKVNASSNAANCAIMAASFGAGVVSALSCYHAGGTAASPSATPSGDTLMYFEAVGYGSAVASKNPISVKTTELWSGTAHGYEILMTVTQATTTTARQVISLRADNIQIGNATTNPSFQFLGTGTATFGGDVSITRSSSGGQVLCSISNTSNTASATAVCRATAAGSSAEGAGSEYVITGGTTWSVYAKGSNSSFTIRNSSLDGGEGVFSIKSDASSVSIGAVVTHAYLSQLTVRADSLGVSVGAVNILNGISVHNATAAAAGWQQGSPGIHWRGNGWKTDATAASQAVSFMSYVIPVQGAAAPTGYLRFGAAINVDSVDTEILRLDSGGGVQAPGYFNAARATGTTAGGSTVGFMLGTAPGLIGIYWGSGAPTISALQGSIYLRTDGSSTATRLYVNTNGTTGWTNFTSAT